MKCPSCKSTNTDNQDSFMDGNIIHCYNCFTDTPIRKWTGKNLKEIIKFTGLHSSVDDLSWLEYVKLVETDGFVLFNSKGKHKVEIGDSIIKSEHGEFEILKEGN